MPEDSEGSDLGIGEKIRKLRDAKEVTRHELAEKVNISTRYLGLIERETTVPSIRLLVIIAECLGVELGDLMDE